MIAAFLSGIWLLAGLVFVIDKRADQSFARMAVVCSTLWAIAGYIKG